jgi:predicted ABC-type ATPase
MPSSQKTSQPSESELRQRHHVPLETLLSETLFPPEEDHRPLYLAIAGANGAGKSTVFNMITAATGRGIPFFNVDQMALEMRRMFPGLPKPDDAGWAVTNTLREKAVEGGYSFATELLLADIEGKRTATLAQARASEKNFRTVLIYITLDSPDLAVARVQQRQQDGAHGFPPQEIRDNFRRSHDALPYALRVVDAAIVLDNSQDGKHSGTMVALATLKEGRIQWQADKIAPHMRSILAKLEPR